MGFFKILDHNYSGFNICKVITFCNILNSLPVKCPSVKTQISVSCLINIISLLTILYFKFIGFIT